MNIVACRPVDVTGLQPYFPAGFQFPAPMLDDTLRECNVCAGGCWVGPRKLALVAAGAAVAVCFTCVYRLNLAGPVVNLDPGRVELPRH